MECRTYLHTGAGWSVEPDGALDSERTLVVVFGEPGLLDAPARVERIIETFPRAAIMGCSRAGEGSLAVGVARFPEATLRATCARIAGPGGSYAAGAAIASRLDCQDLRAVLILCDGLQVNASELVRGIDSVLPPTVVVTGALAGDGEGVRRPWVIAGRRVVPGYVSAVGLYGKDAQARQGSQSGWETFGLEHLALWARGNALCPLEGRPAL